MRVKRRYIKLGFILTFFLAFLYLSIKLGIFERENIKSIFLAERRKGRFGIFFTFFSGVLMVFFVPLSWFSPLAAFFFGLKGWIYVLGGSFIAAIASFYISRIFKEDIRKIIIKIYNRKERKISLKQLSHQIEKYGLGYIFFLRSMPFIPYTLANYIAGLTSLSVKDYVLGTILGLLPNQIINSLFYFNAINITKGPWKAFMAGLAKGLYVFVVFLWQRKTKYNVKD